MTLINPGFEQLSNNLAGGPPHINNKIAKAKRFLQMVSHITRDAFGPKPRLMRWAYCCIVCPMIIYGALCWGHELEHVGILNS